MTHELSAEYLGNSIIFRDIGPGSTSVGKSNMIKFFVIYEVIDIKVFLPFS